MLIGWISPSEAMLCFSTLRCGSWIDALQGADLEGADLEFQYPSMRVVD